MSTLQAILSKGNCGPPAAFHRHHCERRRVGDYFTNDIKTLKDLLIHGLQDIYCAEQQYR